MLKMFPVNVLPNYFIKRISVSALLTVINSLLYTVSLLRFKAIIFAFIFESAEAATWCADVWSVEYFDVCFQSLFVCIEGTVRAIKENPVFKVFTVDIPKVTFVGREELRGERTGAAAERFCPVVLKRRQSGVRALLDRQGQVLGLNSGILYSEQTTYF